MCYCCLITLLLFTFNFFYLVYYTIYYTNYYRIVFKPFYLLFFSTLHLTHFDFFSKLTSQTSLCFSYTSSLCKKSSITIFIICYIPSLSYTTLIFTLSHNDTFLLLIYNKKILLNVNALILIHQIHHYVPIHINNAPHAFGLMDRFHIIFTPKNGLMENNALNSALVMLLIVQYIYLLLKNTTHYLMAISILILLILTLKNLNLKFILHNRK